MLAVLAIGFKAKAQCYTYTTTNNFQYNNTAYGNSMYFEYHISNSSLDNLYFKFNIINLNGTGDGDTTNFSFLTSSNYIDIYPTFNSLTSGTYNIFIQIIDSTNTSCNSTVFSNTVGVVNCPTLTINTNLVGNVLNDPSGLFTYTVDVFPSVSYFNFYYTVYPVSTFSTPVCNTYFMDNIYSFPNSYSHKLNNDGTYVKYANFLFGGTQCVYAVDTFYVATGISPPPTINFYNSNLGNYCYNQQDSLSQQILVTACNVPNTCSLVATVKWPSPIPTQTYVLTYNGNLYFKLDLSNTLAQYTFNPGTYAFPITFSTTDGTQLFYESGTNDTLLYTLNINSCGNLQGSVYLDNDLSCTQNGGEQGHYGLNVIATNTLGQNYYAWTDATGNYDFFNIPAGTYTIQYVDYNYGYSVTCTNNQPHLTAVSVNSVTIEHFAINCLTGVDYGAYGAWVSGSPMFNGLFPGLNSTIYPNVNFNPYCNNGNTPAQIKLVLTPCVKYDAIATSSYTWIQTPDIIIPSATGDTVVWNNVSPNIYWLYYNLMAPVITCTNAQVGDTACFTLMVYPLNDNNPTNNIFTFCRAIGVSYDPNSKEVSPAGTTAMGYIPPTTQELTYTIHFQNTGSASALNIYVLDTLSQYLNVNSLKIISSSHSMQPIMLSNNVIKFNFPNIMLADSTHNEPQSHGYVTYKINLKPSLPLGTQIKNTGYIYFDYNEPVVTNTTKSTLYLVQGLASYSKNNNLQVYPNPSTNSINIKSNVHFVNYKIVDITGREVLSNTVNTVDSILNIPINMLDNGSYIIYLQDENHEVSSQKIMKLSPQK